MKSDLEDVKVGDKIWTIQEGWTVVARIDNSSDFCIETRYDCYLPDGRNLHGDKHPSAFLENPFEKEITREVEEDILHSFISSFYDGTKEDKMLYDVDEYLNHKYKPLPTVEEAAEKLGITVEQLKQISNG